MVSTLEVECSGFSYPGTWRAMRFVWACKDLGFRDLGFRV